MIQSILSPLYTKFILSDINFYHSVASQHIRLLNYGSLLGQPMHNNHRSPLKNKSRPLDTITISSATIIGRRVIRNSLEYILLHLEESFNWPSYSGCWALYYQQGEGVLSVQHCCVAITIDT